MTTSQSMHGLQAGDTHVRLCTQDGHVYYDHHVLTQAEVDEWARQQQGQTSYELTLAHLREAAKKAEARND